MGERGKYTRHEACMTMTAHKLETCMTKKYPQRYPGCAVPVRSTVHDAGAPWVGHVTPTQTLYNHNKNKDHGQRSPERYCKHPKISCLS